MSNKNTECLIAVKKVIQTNHCANSTYFNIYTSVKNVCNHFLMAPDHLPSLRSSQQIYLGQCVA